MTQSWLNKTALITGASSGIGAATARRLARAGLRTILTARRVDRLEAVRGEILAAGGAAEIIPADLGSEAERQALFARVSDQFGPVDVLVNNAGMGWYGYYAEMPWELARDVLRVDVEAAIHLTRLCLPGMLARRSGRIINIGSIIGSIPSQGTALYSASKGFLDNFSTVLYRETRGSGVEVCLVRPGAVRTDFVAAAGRQNALRYPQGEGGISPERVAEKVWELVRRPRRVAHVPGWMVLANLLEPLTGWLQDLIGPVDLKRQKAARDRQRQP